MALLDIGNIYNAAETDPIFVRFQGAALVAAKDVKAEDPQTPLHEQRAAWADGMLSGNLDAVRQRVRQLLRFSIASNSTFQTSGVGVTDNDVAFMVASALALPQTFA